MPPTHLPNIADLHSYTDLQQTELLDYLFEPSPAIHASLLPVIRTAKYSNYTELIDACQIRFLSLAANASPSTSTNTAPSTSLKTTSSSLGAASDQPMTATSQAAIAADGVPTTISTSPAVSRQSLLSVLGSHPRLGEKKIESATSAAEQAGLQSESDELSRLNQEYEEKFPGVRFVSFVNGRSRDVIMKEMRERIDRGDFGKEVDAALQAMCDIAKDRASKVPMRPVIHASTEDQLGQVHVWKKTTQTASLQEMKS